MLIEMNKIIQNSFFQINVGEIQSSTQKFQNTEVKAQGMKTLPTNIDKAHT